MNAHSNSSTILALALHPTVLANAAATAFDALAALLAVDTQPAAAAIFAQVLLSEVLAQCSSPAVFASGSVTFVWAKLSAVYGLRRRNKAAERVLTGAASIFAPPAVLHPHHFGCLSLLHKKHMNLRFVMTAGNDTSVSLCALAFL